MVVVLAMILGGYDYERAITTAVMCGLGHGLQRATTGCIVGTMLGASRLPTKWTAPLHDTVFERAAGVPPHRDQRVCPAGGRGRGGAWPPPGERIGACEWEA